MAELLKNIYNEPFFNQFVKSVLEVVPQFNKDSFIRKIYAPEWDKMELKQRMRHITIVLKNHLFDDFITNSEILLQLIPVLLKNGFKPDNLEFIFLPDFIEIYGLDNYKTSINALEEITQFVSCEFAVRPFVIKYPGKMLKQMLSWSKHKNVMVRRLSSEGCRPRLPWAIALPSLKENPTLILPILENLKNDTSEYVRRSVANNLNDIAKDNPEITIRLVKAWKGKSIEIDKLVKHASRTLLKQGNPELMLLFGFGSIKEVQIEEFKILTPKVKIGANLEFTFRLKNRSKLALKIRLEYAIHYQKANGSLSKKVYKISEKKYAANSSTTTHRKQSFRVISTRKFHVGEHKITLIVNGNALETAGFILLK